MMKVSNLFNQLAEAIEANFALYGEGDVPVHYALTDDPYEVDRVVITRIGRVPVIKIYVDKNEVIK